MLDGEIDNVRETCDTTIGRVQRYRNALGLNELLKLYEECVIMVRVVEGPVANLSFVK